MKAMKKMSMQLGAAILATLLIAGIVAVSCTAQIPGDPAPGPGPGMGTDPENGGTPTPTPETVTPAPGGMTGPTPPEPIPPAGGGETTTPIETPVAPPTPEVLDAERQLQAKLDAAIASVPGTRVKFINCTQSPCTARLEAKTLTAMRDLLASVSQDNQGRIDFVVAEQLDGYMGQSYYADVTIGTDKVKAVPTDPAELLVN